MNLPRFLAARFLRPEGAFLSFVTVAAAGGIALAVAVLVLVLSVANGFERALREEVLGAVPQLVVEGYGVDPAAYLEALAALPGIEGVEPFEELGALALVAQAGMRTQSRPVQVLGVAPGAGGLSGLTPQQKERLRPGAFGVFLGAELARGLALVPGDSLTLVVPNLRLTLAGAFPVQRTVTVLGLLETGTLLDGQTLLAHLDDVRALARRGGPRSLRLGVRDVLAVGEDRAQVEAALAALSEAASGTFRFSDWRDRYGALFEAIAVQKKMLFLVLTLLVAMAAFNLIAMVLMAIRQQSAALAMLSSLGLGGAQLRAVFRWHGALVAGGGILAGVLGGLVLCAGEPALVAWISELRGAPLMGAYFVHHLPVAPALGDCLAVAAVAGALATLAITLAARRADALAPQEVLRHE